MAQVLSIETEIAHLMFDAMMRLMRTTLNIDDDIVEVARSLAAHRHHSIGKVISDMARRGLQSAGIEKKSESIRNGIRIIQRPSHTSAVTLEMVNRLRDELC
jgi:hypothetical protein